MSQVKSPTLSAGLYAVDLQIHSQVATGSVSTTTELQYVPHFYLAHPLTDRLTAGFGVTVPFGLGTEWSDAPMTTYATENSVSDTVYSFALGYEATSQWNIGATLDIHSTEFAFGAQALEIEGQDNGVGFSLGTQYSVTDSHHVGFTYRYAPTLDLEGTERVIALGLENAVAYNGIALPATAALSYNFTPSAKWDLGVSVEWINWDSLNTVSPQGGVANQALAFDWDTSYMYELGGTYVTDNGWSFSAGYVYNQNSLPDSTFNPAVSDADRHWLSCGLGRQYEQLSWYLAYQYAFSERTVTQNAQGLNGDYQAEANSLMLTLTYEL